MPRYFNLGLSGTKVHTFNYQSYLQRQEYKWRPICHVLYYQTELKYALSYLDRYNILEGQV